MHRKSPPCLSPLPRSSLSPAPPPPPPPQQPKRRSSPLSPLGGTNNNSTSRHQHHSKTYGTTFKRKKSTQNGPGSGTSKKSNFRGTSEAENEIDTGFQPREINRDILLCEEYPGVHLDRDVYSTLTSKAPRSATRLIRLLMKHFFSQDTLARSSLSGEGIYKDRLQPEVIEAIKLFIKRRHPKLKNGSINLCMTDVCVQARRVNKNQRTRVTVAGSSGGSGGAASFSGAGSGSSGVQPPPLVLAISDSNNNELCQPVLKMEATDRDEDIDDEDEDEGMEEEEVTTIVKEENEGLDVRKMPAATSCAGSSDSHSLCSSSHIGSTSSSSNQSSPFLTHSHLVSQHHHKSLLHSGSSNRPPRFESLSVVAD